jgi:hypothetical protein
MSEPALLAIAAALVCGERIGDGGSWQALLTVVRAKLDVTATPATAAGIDEVARRLAEESAADEEFAAQLAAAWELAARGGRGSHNIVLGTPTGSVIQASTITDVSLSTQPRPRGWFRRDR